MQDLTKADHYVIIWNGELVYDGPDYEETMREAQFSIFSELGWHHRHNLPLKVTPEISKEFDLRVYALAGDNLIALPLQEWCDQFYQDMKDDERKTQENEEKRFLELHAKYIDRLDALKEKYNVG